MATWCVSEPRLIRTPFGSKVKWEPDGKEEWVYALWSEANLICQ